MRRQPHLRQALAIRPGHGRQLSPPERGAPANLVRSESCELVLFHGRLLFMKRAPHIAVFLAVIYLLLSFNAYACLLPMSGGAVMEKGSDCAKPQEQPAGRLCDAFKSLGVQTVPPFQPLPDTHAQGLAHDLAATSILQPIASLHSTVFSGPPLIRIDILDLTSLLRI